MDGSGIGGDVRALQSELDDVVVRVASPSARSLKFSSSSPDFVAALSTLELVITNLGSPESHLAEAASQSFGSHREQFRNDLADYGRLRAVSRLGVPPFGQPSDFTDPLLAYASADDEMIRLYARTSARLDPAVWSGDVLVAAVQNLMHSIFNEVSLDVAHRSVSVTGRADRAIVDALTAIVHHDQASLDHSIADLSAAYRRSIWIRERYRGLNRVPVLAIGLSALAFDRGLHVPEESLAPAAADYLQWLTNRPGPLRLRTYTGHASLLNPLITDPANHIPRVRLNLDRAWLTSARGGSHRNNI